MTKKIIYVVYYSTHGHVQTMANTIMEGLKKNEKIETRLRQFPEILTQDILDKMRAPEKNPDVPEFTLDELQEGDAFMFGFPTRFGTYPAQVKHFWDTTGKLWSTGALDSKIVGIFHCSGAQCAGQETTALTFLSNLFHHGMIFVPLGLSHPHLHDNSEVIGGSAFGCGTVSDAAGTRQPSKKELELAIYHAEKFAKTVLRFN
ncbi:hypothetical protein BB561_000676 [Smittium simulii]|uniref:Flavodoxin-like domain-containing protein n=1 Tax=Smittium simulii TaxID=133385 RepID=A0A2T9YY80_9FUNG|nr:hypothetical protein BB561_000676 [Smittium simulii]